MRFFYFDDGVQELMRRISLLVLLLLAAAALAASAAPAKTVFFIRGGGWGHGIGMSQWGAYGYAVQGGTYRQILSLYYPGTNVGSSENQNPVMSVTLASNRTSVTVGSGALFYATDANGTHNIAKGTQTLATDLKITKKSGDRITLVSPVTFSRSTGFIALNGTRYRGTVVVTKSGGRLTAVNRVRLEGYLRGVVPNESPSSWPAAALKAQAVAARSYALAVGGLTTTTSSQVYRGVDSETDSTDAAVAATAGEIRSFSGTVAATFFYSSSGGRTSTKNDEWGSGDLPYLQSVDDAQYDVYSPRYRWDSKAVDALCHRSSYTRLGIAKRISVPSGFYDIVVNRNSSGRAGSVDLIGSTTRTVSGGAFKDQFRLCSTRYWVGVIRMHASKNQVAPGERVRLFGFARKMGSTLTVQQRLAGGAWQNAAKVGVADNRFEIVAHPTQTTYYRVRAGVEVGPVVVVKVA
jgi:stage II sporulation protein D